VDPTSRQLKLDDLNVDASIYLLPDSDSDEQAEKNLRKICKQIFAHELEGWWSESSAWPQDLSYGVFVKWPLLETNTNRRRPLQWSRDGRFIVYGETAPDGREHLWVVPMEDKPASARKPIQFLQTEFNEIHGQLSADSRWMAYVSDESGERQVYVRPFPSAEGVWRISTRGGDQPRWRGDGKELFYVAADGKMMAVPIKTGSGPKASLEPGTPVPLFDSHILAIASTNTVFQYDVTSNGMRFLINTVNGTQASSPFTVLVNWSAGPKK
jgi:Tol biopolymer transport system component